MWAGEELVKAELGDERRARRLMRIVEALVEHAEQSVPRSFGSWSETQAAYRFWSNPRVDWQAILEPHRLRTAERAAEHPVVLVAQDTTEINLTRHRATEGLGYLGRAECRGLLLHTCLALTPDGLPLGIVDQRMWVRPPAELGKRATRKRRALGDKESRRWLDGLRAVERTVGGGQAVLVGDRESDLYDLFAAPRAAHVQLLVRVCREQRRVDHPQRHLRGAIEAEPIGGRLQLTLPRTGKRAEREAEFDVRWLTVGWHSPALSRRRAEPLPVQLVLLTERAPEAAKSAVRWLLATTLPVGDLTAAARVVAYYTRRWQIERFHYTLKSGCSVEKHRRGTADNVRRAAACLSIAAWRLLWLTTAARATPEAPATIILSTPEWQALEAVARRRYRRPIQGRPPSLGEAVRLIARLGGHLGRTCDGPPGVKVLWRGLARLSDITVGWLAAQEPG